jgi:hypothetical protein
MLQLIDNLNELVEAKVQEMAFTTAEALGLDPRAGYKIYVSEDCLVVAKGNARSLDYYGGFEYIDPEYRRELGNYVIYLAETDRVNNCIENYKIY